jgi:hypothetical protein
MAQQFVFSNNGISTLAGAISNVATTCQLAAGTGVLFPNPTNGQQFALTLSQAASPTVFEIVYCTARSGDVLTIVRAQEGTSAQSFSANDNANSLITSGVLGAFSQSFRIGLFGNLTLCVNQSTGNDANNGLTPGTAFKTLQKAYNVAVSVYDTAGWQITILNGANITTTGTALLAVSGVIGGGSLVIDGGGFSIAATNGSCFVAFNGAIFTLQNWGPVTSTGTAVGQGNGISAVNGGSITIGVGMVLGVNASFDYNAQFGGQIFGPAAYTVTTGAHVIHWRWANGGQLYFNGTVVTLQSTPSCSSEWANGENNATALINCTFTGTGTGLTALVEMNASLDTGAGALNLPGNGTYTLNAGGQKR